MDDAQEHAATAVEIDISDQHPTVLREAIRLATAGFYCGITSPNEKRPHPQLMARGSDGTPGGVWVATTDLTVIRSWWTDCPTGGLFVSPRGTLAALDIDDCAACEAAIGSEHLRYLLDRFPTTNTPSGGHHIWFRVPDGVKAKSLPRNLEYGEFIYEGFYALMPPSQATNKSGDVGTYTSTTALPVHIESVPEIPYEVLNLIRGAGPTKEITVNQGHRHSAILRVGVELSRAGATVDQIDGALRRLNTIFTPPLTTAELDREVKGVVHWIAERDPRETGRPSAGQTIEFLSMQELAERPAPSWLVPNLIPDRGLGLIIGPPTAGKSFFLLDLAQSVCRGLPVLGHPDAIPTRTGWVLVFLPEAAASWGSRTKAYCEFHELGYSEDFVCCIQQNDLADQRVWEQIRGTVDQQIAERGEPPVLVIVDTVSASIPGRDENAQADITRLLSNLQELVALGIAVIAAHHTMKHSDVYRGSSVFLGNCDWMISIVPSGRLREFRAVKLRDASTIDGKAFEIKPHGDSAVCVGAAALGPWATFNSLVNGHPGLLAAFVHHGLEVPGGDRPPWNDDDLRRAGVSLKAIQATWNRNDPIRPPQKENSTKYKSTYGKRETALLNVAYALIRGGVLTAVNGTFSRQSRDLKVVVRQVKPDEAD